VFIVFSLHRESPDLILGDESLISKVVLSHLMSVDGTLMIDGCTLTVGGCILWSSVLTPTEYRSNVDRKSHVQSRLWVLRTCEYREGTMCLNLLYSIFFYTNGSDMLVLYRVKGPSIDSALAQEIIHQAGSRFFNSASTWGLRFRKLPQPLGRMTQTIATRPCWCVQ
jgi:hypothetical protein